MKILTLLAAILVAASSSFALAGALDDLTGKKRVVLLFSKSRSLASLDEQVDLLRARRPGLGERDMIVLVTAGRQETIATIGYASVPRGAALDLKTRFEPNSSGLTIVLIGKDGSEKARWDKVVNPQEIFDLIDAMPMRQSEIQNSG